MARNRNFFSAKALLLAVAAVSAVTSELAVWSFSRPAVAAERQVTVYTPSGRYLAAVNPKFEQETGIRVKMIEAGSGEILQRVKAEAARPLGDVIAAMSTNLLDQSANLVEASAGPDWPGFSKVVGNVFIVNTKTLGDLPMPKGWKDLANPAYKGNIAYAGADKSGSAYAQLATLLGVYGEEQGWKVFEAALANFIITDSSGKVVNGVGRGEYAIGITSEDSAYAQKLAGAPVEIVYPSEGVLVYADGSAIIRNAPNRDAAAKYIAFLSRPDVQKIAVDTFHRRPVAAGVEIPAGLPAQPQEAKMPAGFVDTIDRDAVIKRYLALIRR